MSLWLKRQSLGILLFLFFTNSGFSQLKGSYRAELDSLINEALVRPFSGVVLITEKGKPKYSRVFGFAKFKERVPLSPDAQFVLLSNSKQITAVLILQQVDKGKNWP